MHAECLGATSYQVAAGLTAKGHRRRLLSIDFSCLWVAQQQTRRPPHADPVVDRRDRQTDGRTDVQPFPRPWYSMRAPGSIKIRSVQWGPSNSDDDDDEEEKDDDEEM